MNLIMCPKRTFWELISNLTKSLSNQAVHHFWKIGQVWGVFLVVMFQKKRVYYFQHNYFQYFLEIFEKNT